jgi:hypothetical protein
MKCEVGGTGGEWEGEGAGLGILERQYQILHTDYICNLTA